MIRWKELVDIPVNNYSDIVMHIDQYLLKNTFKLLVSEKIDLTYLLNTSSSNYSQMWFMGI